MNSVTLEDTEITITLKIIIVYDKKWKKYSAQFNGFPEFIAQGRDIGEAKENLIELLKDINNS